MNLLLRIVLKCKSCHKLNRNLKKRQYLLINNPTIQNKMIKLMKCSLLIRIKLSNLKMFKLKLLKISPNQWRVKICLLIKKTFSWIFYIQENRKKSKNREKRSLKKFRRMFPTSFPPPAPWSANLFATLIRSRSLMRTPWCLRFAMPRQYKSLPPTSLRNLNRFLKLR